MPATVEGVIQINGQPASRRVRAFSYNSVVHTTRGDELTESLTLGSATSDPSDGSYSITLHKAYSSDVFVVAFDDMGQAFTPSAALTVGDRVRPSNFQGFVFECDGAGTLPATEPTWNNDLEASHVYGTASLRAKPFYRPQVHGPITPETTGYISATHWRVRSTASSGAPYNWFMIGYLRFNTQNGWSDTLSPTPLSGGDLSGYPKANGFNPSLTESTRWISAALPGWLGCSFSEAQSVTAVEITPHDVGAHMNQMPGDLYVEYSTDAGATWETLLTVPSIDAWTALTAKTFTVQS